MAKTKAEKAAYMREWTRKNKERLNAERRKRYADDAEHRAKILEQCKTYRESDPDAYKDQQSEKYQKHGHKYRARLRNQYEEDPQKFLDRNDKWRVENPEKVAAGKADWEKRFKAEKPEEYKRQRRKIYEKGREEKLAYSKKWREENPHLNAKKQAAYKARKERATVAWANDFFIEEAYALAQLRTQITGVKWEVDHIVPFCSDMNPTVCGLHVENNLRVITEIANRQKYAQFGDGVPAEHLWT